MAILKEDIKIVESAVMSNEYDSGGQQTAIEIVSGEINNVFLPFSRLNAVTGVVNSRKIFASISTDSNEVFSGAHFILLSQPANPKVHITLFYTGDHNDTKETVQEQIESYVVKATRAPINFLEEQLEGQRKISVYQDLNQNLPEIGDVLLLIEDDKEQYIKVQELEHEEREFIIGTTSCTKRVVTIGISLPLEHTFYGNSVSCGYSVPTAHIRFTQVADAAHYYGISPVVTAATIGDNIIQVNDVYTQIVPSTRTEKSVIDILALSDQIIPFTSGGETFDLISNSVTREIDITINNRAYTYVGNIGNLPAASTFTAEYRVFDRWYKIISDADGILSGDGNGTISMTTGSYSLTLSELPDVDTKIILKWGLPIAFIDQVGSGIFNTLSINAVLGTGAIEPGSVEANWIGGGITYTAFDDGVGGFTGDGTGSISYPTGEITLYPNKIPDSNQSVVFDFDYSVNLIETFTPTVNGSGFIDVTVANSIKPNSLRVQWPVSNNKINNTIYFFSSWFNPFLSLLSDVGNSNAILRLDGGTDAFPGETASIIDNITGQVYFTPAQDFYYKYLFMSSVFPFEIQTAIASTTAAYSDSDTITITYQQAGSATVSGQEIIPSPPLKIQLLQNLAQTVVPGTVRFKIATVQHSDQDGRGNIYLNDNTLVGTINYELGEVSLTGYTGGNNVTMTIESLVTVNKGWHAIEAVFKTPGAPVQPLGLFISATAYDGTAITATADLAGDIDDNQIQGTVNYNTGIVKVKFGEDVLDSSLTPEEKAEWWYDASNIEGGYIFRPTPIYPNTVKFNAVLYSYLALSKEIIGLDLVRLPSNGRVPQYRKGDILVIHEPFEETMPSPLAPSQVVNLPHEFIGKNTIYLVDATGVLIPETGFYIVDEDPGDIIFDAALDLTGYDEPLVAHYRIEDMHICTEVQINGTLGLQSSLARDFGTNAFVSTAVILGDLFSKIEYFFTQKTWINIWDDQRSGSDSIAKYNLLQYPIFIQNKNSIKERWALVFTSSTTFNIIGEYVGVIGTGDTASDAAPINPNTLEPYWVLYAAGFGSGYATSNVIRFNSRASAAPIWNFRTMETGAIVLNQDEYSVQVRGDCSS